MRVLKSARVFNRKTGAFVKTFEKFGLPNFKQETDDVMKSVGKVKIGTGFEQPESDLETYGDADFLLAAFGTSCDLRIVGSYQSESGGQETREVIGRGNIFDFGRPEMKMNEKEGAGKPKITWVYYRETLGSKVIFEYDANNDIVIVNGVDLMAAHRAAVE